MHQSLARIARACTRTVSCQRFSRPVKVDQLDPRPVVAAAAAEVRAPLVEIKLMRFLFLCLSVIV